jgi:bacterioferritin-associated ferredoxin
VYICLCNALTDRKLKDAVAANNSQKPGDVYAACGCRAQCGQCVKAIVAMLRDNASRVEGQLQGAD